MSEHRRDITDLGRLLAIEPGAARTLYSRAIAAARSGREAIAAPTTLALASMGGMDVTVQPGQLFGTAGPLAVINVHGPMMFACSTFEYWMGACPDELLCQALRDAADDGKTKATLLRVHSPGGTIAGNSDVAEAMAYATAKKPVHVLVNDECCSKAMILAGAATECVMTASAMIGHVGTLWMGYDDSALYEELGIKPVPAASNANKPVGWPGVAMTEEVMANRQAWIDEQMGNLVAVIAKGRGISEAAIRGWKTAVFGGSEALKAGLVSAVVEPGAYAAGLVERYSKNVNPASGPGRPGAAKSHPTGARIAMTPAELREKHGDAVALIEAAAVDKYKVANPPQPKAPETPKAASFAELKAAFATKDGGDKFIYECLDKGHSMDAAKTAWADKVEAENVELRKKLPPSGAAPAVPNFTQQDPNASKAPPGAPKDYAEAVKQVQARDKSKLPVAMNTARKEHPELHKAWTNAGCPEIK